MMAALTDRANRMVKKLFGSRGEPSSPSKEEDTGLAPKRAFKKSIMRQARKIRERRKLRDATRN